MIVCSATLHSFEVKKLAVSSSGNAHAVSIVYIVYYVVLGQADALSNMGGPEGTGFSARNRSPCGVLH